MNTLEKHNEEVTKDFQTYWDAYHLEGNEITDFIQSQNKQLYTKIAEEAQRELLKMQLPVALCDIDNQCNACEEGLSQCEVAKSYSDFNRGLEKAFIYWQNILTELNK